MRWYLRQNWHIPLMLVCALAWSGFFYYFYLDHRRDQQTELYRAMGMVDGKELRNYLRDGDVSEQDFPDVLCYCAETDCPIGVRALLDAGADPNATDQRGRRAVEVARRKGYSDIVRMLEAARASQKVAGR